MKIDSEIATSRTSVDIVIECCLGIFGALAGFGSAPYIVTWLIGRVLDTDENSSMGAIVYLILILCGMCLGGLIGGIGPILIKRAIQRKRRKLK